MAEIDIEKSLYLSRISLNNLFGYRNINFDLSASRDSEAKSINILYGPNGLGKSTILRFIYNFLAHDRGRGQKSWISKLPFSNAELVFSDGRGFHVTRARNGDLSIEYFGNPGYESFKIVTKDFSVLDDAEGSDIEKLLSLLESLSVEIFYMTDKREFLTTSKALGEHLYKRPSKLHMHFLDLRGALGAQKRENSIDYNLSIEDLSQTISTLFRQDIVESGVLGQQNANSIHLDVVRTLAKGEIRSNETRADLTALLNLVRAETLDAERVGAVARIDYSG